MYQWSVPAGKGRFIGSTTGRTVQYESSIAGNALTTAEITCQVTIPAHTPTISDATLTSLTELGIGSIIVNILANAQGSSTIFDSSNIQAGSDTLLATNINIRRARWFATARQLFIEQESGDSESFPTWWTNERRNRLSFYIVADNGNTIEIPASWIIHTTSNGIFLQIPQDNVAIQVLNGILSTHQIVLGVGNSNSIGTPEENASDTHTITINPNQPPVVTFNVPYRLEINQTTQLIANIQDPEGDTIQASDIQWTTTLGTISNTSLRAHPTITGAYQAIATLNAGATTGAATITCQATAAGQSGSATTTIEIVPTNTAPQVTIVSIPTRINRGQTVDVEISVSDPGDTYEVTWEILINGAYTSDPFTSPNAEVSSFLAPNTEGTYTIRATVTDSFGASTIRSQNTEIVAPTEGIQQFFSDPSLPNAREWTDTRQLFQDRTFRADRNTATQAIWIRNSTAQAVDITITRDHTGGTGNINNQRRDWIRFDYNNGGSFTSTLLSFTLEAGATRRYYIRITIPTSQLNAPNAGELFPATGLKINISITEPTNHILRTRLQTDFNQGNYRSGGTADRLQYHNGALRRIPIGTPTSVTWSRIFDIHSIVGGTALGPYRILALTSNQNTPNQSNGNTITTNVRYIISRLNNARSPVLRDIIQVNSGSPRITRPTDGTVTDFDIPESTPSTHPYLQLTITLNDSTQVSSTRPDTERTSVEYANIYIETQTTSQIEYDAYITHQPIGVIEPDGQLPEGIVILNKSDIPVSVPNNKIESFKFNYNRAGGNGNFTLKLNADWDEVLNIDYDYTLIYIKDTNILYRGTIERIRTHLGTPESIEISGSGPANQLKAIQVYHKFTEETPQNILTTLLDKYVSGEHTPTIYYNSDNIDDSSTTTSFDFKNENLFDVINKVAGAAGANPTGRGDTGTDIIWGVDEQSNFYFLRKLTKLRYQFHTGKNITFDDAKEAPNFNSIIFVGDTAGYELENFIPDGDCELGTGNRLTPTDFEPIIWETGPNVPVTIVRDLEHVKHGSQAYQFPITHDDSTDTDTSFRTTQHKLPNNTDLNLSLYARCETTQEVHLQLEIEIIHTISAEHSDQSVADPKRYNMRLSTEFQKFVINDIDTDTRTYTERYVRLNFRALQKRDNEAITIDQIYLYRADANLPGPTTITPPFDPATINPAEESHNDQNLDTNGQVATEEDPPNPDHYKFKREVFASDGKYEIIITDLTQLSEFGRRKEVIQEVDSIRTLEEAYQYGRALLGANATEARRASLKVTDNPLSFQPFDDDEIKWGYARIFGSTNPNTRYEYSIISVEHEWTNEEINSNIQLGAPRPNINNLVHQLTARDRYRGHRDTGKQTTVASETTIEPSTNQTVFSSRTIPTTEQIQSARQNSDRDPIWIVGDDQEANENRSSIMVSAVKEGYTDIEDTDITTTAAPSQNYRFRAGTILRIRSETLMNVIYSPSVIPTIPEQTPFRTILVGTATPTVNTAERWVGTAVSIPTAESADYIIVNLNEQGGTGSYERITPWKWVGIPEIRSLPEGQAENNSERRNRIEIDESEGSRRSYIGRDSSFDFLFTSNQARSYRLEIRRVAKYA